MENTYMTQLKVSNKSSWWETMYANRDLYRSGILYMLSRVLIEFHNCWQLLIAEEEQRVSNDCSENRLYFFAETTDEMRAAKVSKFGDAKEAGKVLLLTHLRTMDNCKIINNSNCFRVKLITVSPLATLCWLRLDSRHAAEKQKLSHRANKTFLLPFRIMNEC